MQDIPENTRIYSHQLRGGFEAGERKDFTQTLLFISSTPISINTESLTTQFFLNDQISQFQVSINLISSEGKLMHQKSLIQSTKSVYN